MNIDTKSIDLEFAIPWAIWATTAFILAWAMAHACFVGRGEA